MKIPKRIEPLVEAGLVDSVSRPLTSGKARGVLRAVRELMAPPEPKPKRRIGFVQD